MAINVGVVGAGYWGPNLIRNFAALPEANLQIVCDLDPVQLEKIKDNYHGIQITTNFDELLKNPEIEAVVVATPAESHCRLVSAALSSGKHVFVEKPLADNSTDAELLVRLAKENDRVLMVGHIFLYQAAMSRLIELVNQGNIGDIRYLHGVRTSMAGTARLDTNIVWDALVHDAYILPAIFGKAPERILAAGAGYLSKELEDVAFVTFDFGDDRLAQVYVSWYALQKERQITVIGKEAILHYDDLADEPLMRYNRRYEQGEELDPQGRPRWHWRDHGGKAVPLPAAEPMRDECRHFLRCIEENREPMTDGYSGLVAVQIIEACQQSLMQNNRWVEVG